MTSGPQPPVPPGPELPAPPALAPSRTPTYPAYPTYGSEQRHLPPPSKAMAGWALALSIFPCFFGISTLVSIGLAITVLVRSRDGRNHGKGLAIAALVVAGLWIVGGILAAVAGLFQGLNADADRDSSGQVTGRDEVSVLKLRLGDCFDYPALFAEGEDPVQEATVDAVPCSQPHQFEVYHAFDLRGEDYPGEDAVANQASTGCLAAFRKFVGVPYGKSQLEPYVMYPQATSWRLFDDRGVTCTIGEPGRTTTGTLEGSRR